MATITSAASGNWSAGATWVGGVVPNSADTVTIASGRTVTLDTTGLACSTLTVNGTLKGHRTANSDLTAQTTITVAVNAVMDFGAPGDEITANCTLTLNNAKAAWLQGALTQNQQGTSDSCNWSFYGGPSRVRLTTLASAASSGQPVVVLATASHGWQAGDRIVIEDTTNTTSNAFTYGTVSSTSGANVTLSANLTVAHAAGAKIGNLTSNLKIQSNNTGAANTGAGIYINMGNSGTTGGTHVAKFRDVEFYNLGESGVARAGIQIYTNVAPAPIEAVFDQCSFDTRNYIYLQTQMPVDFTDCVYYASLSPVVANVWRQGVIRATGGLYVRLSQIFSGGSFSNTFNGCAFSTLSTGLVALDQGVATNCTFSGNITAVSNGDGPVVLDSCRLDGRFNEGIFRSQGFRRGGRYQITDCLLSAGAENAVASEASAPFWVDGSYVRYTNKDQDTTQQEWWSPRGVIKRNNSEKNRSTSSISIKPLQTSTAESKTQQISCANGSTIRVIGYVKMDTSFYNGGTYTAPTVSLSGLGATPVTFTASAAANNAWQQYNLSITNTTGYDGNFTLTYSVQAQAVTTGTVYFDGVPDSPFITKCRHYGFVFNETSPTREVNPYTVATEAVAAAYTGVTINATTKRVTFGAGTIDTQAKLYDYSQAWGCLNIDKDMPWSRAGALLSLSTGWTVVDPQITGVTWGGGTVEFGVPGSITQSFDTARIKFTAAGTYNLAGSAFAGTVELVNTSGGGVTVQAPAGISYTNTGPNITVELPSSDVEIVASALIAGSRVRLYNVTDATEIYNAVLPSAGLVHTLPYSADKVVVLRADHATKLPLEVAGVLTASGLTFLDVQQEDAVYVGNAIDGSAVTEFTADEPNVEVDIDDLDGGTSFRRLYAWMQHYFTTEVGIRSVMFGSVTAIDSGTYVINVAKANILLDNVGVLPVAFMNGDRLIRSDGTSVIAPTSGTIHIDSGFVPVVETGTSGLTASESERLLALDTTYLDAPVSSRLAAASYTAPDNAGIADIDAKTDALATLVADVVDGVEASTVLAKEATAAKAVQNAALAVALGA